jgi:hypothetical protein
MSRAEKIVSSATCLIATCLLVGNAAASVIGVDRYHAPSTTGGDITVTTTSPQRGFTRMQFTDPRVSQEEVTVGDERFTDVWIEGESHTTEPGLPALPIVNRLIGIPDRGAVQLRVLAAEYTEIHGIRVYPFQTMEEPDPNSSPGFTQEPFHWNRQFYLQNAWYPPEVAVLGDPAVMRDVRLVTVSICPVQYNPATATLRVYHNIDIRVEPAPGPGINEKTRTFAQPSSRFIPMYRELENFQYLGMDEEPSPPGTFLIICADHPTPIGFAEQIKEWRQRQGIPTRIATRSETGNSYSQIRNFIQEVYNTEEPPLEFVLLLGDDTGNSSDPFHVPSTGGYGGSDHPYSQLEGSDILADIAIGRLSAQNANSMELVVTKTLRYDQRPYVTGPDWFTHAYLLAGTSHSVSSNINTMEYIRHQMYENGFTEVVLHTHSGHINATLMRQQLGMGRSFFLWRGAYISEMYESDLNGLSNGWMLPFVFAITCGTGNFAGDTGLSEAWIRYGSITNGNGAVVCVGTATSSTHTRFNNTVAAGIGHGFFVTQYPEAGMALVEAKLQLYRTYHPHNTSAVQNFSTWNNLMGDPMLKIWTATPVEFDITFPSEIPLGANRVPVLVEDVQRNPVEGALVCLMKGEETWTRAMTDSSGYLEMPTGPTTIGNLWLTVSKTNYLTYTADISVVQEDLWVASTEVEVDDDNSGGTSGNGDGELNPGEVADLTVTARNFGSSVTATNVVGTMTSFNDALVEMLTPATAGFPDINPGEEVQSQGAFRVQVSSYAQDQDLTPLLLEFAMTQETDTSLVSSPIVSGNAELESHRFLDSNNRLDPGETADLLVCLTNIGHRDVNNVQGILACQDNVITIPDSIGGFGTLTMGGNSTNSDDHFTVTANPATIPGHPVTLQLSLWGDDGFLDTTAIHIRVGSQAQTDPVGPDNYGYYCFDDIDVGYEMVPTFDWIEISTTGEQLPIFDNWENGDDNCIRPLPFTFRMYGVDYDTITICSNGWAALGNQPEFTNFRNYPIPGSQGPDAMMAAFWDDLIVSYNGHVYMDYIEDNGLCVIEWRDMKTLTYNYNETLEIILYDPALYPTQTGDGIIKFQYLDVTDGLSASDDHDYSTVGIEDHNQTDGLQVVYWNQYSPGAAHLQDGRAYLFTTSLEMDFGCLRGQVTDAETSAPLQGAFVSVNGGAYWDSTDVQGNYFIRDLLVNTYAVDCSKTGYNPSSAGVEITANDTTVQDFTLTHPEFLLDIDHIQEELPQGDTTTVVFHLDNQGNGPLSYYIEFDYNTTIESDQLRSGPVEQSAMRRGAYMGTDDPWDRLLWVDVTDVTNDNLIKGVAYAWGKLWVAGAGESPELPNKFYRFDPQGNYLGYVEQPTSTELGFRDLAWDGEYLWGSEDLNIVAVDSNGTPMDTIQGFLNPNRVLAYDPDEDVFYTGNSTSDIIVVDRDGNEVRRYADHGQAIYGLAWFRDDPDGYCLYLFCQEGSTSLLRIVKLNPANGHIQLVVDLEGGPQDRAGGGMITPSWNPIVWAFVGQITGVSADHIGVWDLGPNTAWITYQPEEGTVEPNGQETFQVFLDAREVVPSTYEASLVFHHNAFSSPDTLPVSLTITGAGVEPETELSPYRYSLGQNYPNPFNPVTVIPYSLREPGLVRMTLYNVLGQRVATLVDSRQEAGPQQVLFDARTLASGIYFYHLKAGPYSNIRKMVLLK